MVSSSPADGAPRDTGITVLLAKLYADYIVAEKERPSQGEVPKNVPELILSYLNFLNRDRSDHDPDHLAVQHAAQIIAWECLRTSFRPSSARIKDVVEALGPKGTDVLCYFKTNLHIVRTIEPTEEQIKFTLDPVAEYLAALYLLEANGENREAWHKFLSASDRMPGAPQAIKGFLLAARDCAFARAAEAKVPAFVLDELAKRTGLDLKELKKLEIEHRVNEQIARLSLPVAEDRSNAARALAKIGPQAKAALPALLAALASDKDSEVRIAVAFSLGEIGTSDSVGAALRKALNNDSDSNVRTAVHAAVMGIGNREW
jgi:HEAT repeat protein